MGTRYGYSIDTRSPNLGPLADDPKIIAQWVELTLQTPRGQYWTAPEYGCDVRRYLLAGLTPDALAAIPGEVAAALEDDERISRADVTATTTYLGGGVAAVKLDIKVTPATGSSFELTAIASAETVKVMLRGIL